MTEPVGAYDAPNWFATEVKLPEANNGALLAEPTDGMDDLGRLYVLMARDAKADTRGALQDIQNANEARRAALERQLEALEKQRKAEDDSGFWGTITSNLGTIAKVAGCVAAVAFAVVTAGAGTPVAVMAIAGAVASCASLAQSEFGVFDEVLGKEAADKLGFWLGVGGAALCLGAGSLSLLGMAGESAQAATAATQVAQKVRTVAVVVGGTTAIGAGGAKMMQAKRDHEAENFRADARAALLEAQLQQLLIQQLIEGVSETKERETANVKRIVAMSNLNAAALTAAANGVA